MSWPDESSGGSGGGVNGNGGKIMSLRLGADITVNNGEFTKIPFDQLPENDGFTYNADLEIELQEAGTVSINASVGAVVPSGIASALSVACFIFKNDLPYRQFRMDTLIGPYCTAPAFLKDKGVAGDRYSIWVLATGGDNPTITIHAADGVTGAEIAYL